MRAQAVVGGSILLLLVALSASRKDVAAQSESGRALAERVLADPFDSELRRQYLESLPRDGNYYVLAGDLLLTEEEVLIYLVNQSSAPTSPSPGGELILNVHAGLPDYWKDVAARKLTYAVDLASFSSQPERYRQVVDFMHRAARDWVDTCADCGVSFQHLTEHDQSPSLDNVTFIVRHQDAGGAYLATAFYPHYARSRRYISIDPSYFSSEYDPVGILRHELGHVLGYRHEQVRGVPGCFIEAGQWEALTPYDPRSVMHYPCGGGGDREFRITDTDKEGHRQLYGLSGDDQRAHGGVPTAPAAARGEG